LVGATFVWRRWKIERIAWKRWEMVTFVGIAALAFILRTWNLRDFPNNVFPDEIMTGTVAARAFLSANTVSVFSTVWGDIELPALWFMIEAFFMRAGGELLSVIRLPAAIFGAATVVPLYLLVRSQWGRTAAITGSAVLAFSASNIHFSRLALNNIVPQFFWTACFLFLLRGLRYRRPFDWAVAGLLAGLSEHFYYGTRLLPILLTAFFVYLLGTAVAGSIKHRFVREDNPSAGELRSRTAGFALTALGYLVGFGPLFAYFLTHPNLYFGRGAQMMIWNHIPADWNDLVLMAQTLWPVISENLLGISTHTSQDIMYYGPLLMVPEAALLVLGVALLLWKWRDPAAFLLLLSGLGVLFVGGSLVFYTKSVPPLFAHWTPAFPVFYCAIAIPVGLWFDKDWASLKPGLGWPKYALLTTGLAALCLINVTYYFGSYHANAASLRSEAYRNAQITYDQQVALSRYAASLGASYEVIVVGRMPVPYDADLTRYLLGADVRLTNLPDPANAAALADDANRAAAADRHLAFIFFSGNQQYLPLIQSRYPGGNPGQVNGPTGQPVFFTYVLSAQNSA
jgi:hypothetical protein